MAGFQDREEVEFNASAFVAPLVISKSPQRTRSAGSRHTRQSSSKSRRAASIRSQSQISPPLTPRTSRETFPPTPEPQLVFHNYLRAFYHFHPTSTVSSSTDESSITVPINQGDVILVHSVHPNGWADGTLLASGARGWLPTNYCEAYDHPSIRSLLNALTHLWDLVRDAENGDLAVFTKQDYVRGMIAGVRFFLEKSQCLTRESPLIQDHVGLRRMRKGLLGDLSTFVKTAKKLQEMLQCQRSTVSVFELLDELVLKAFKLVTRAVRFLDIWAQDAVSIPFDFADSSNRPLTPPVDTADRNIMQLRSHSSGSVENSVSTFDHAPVVSRANSVSTREEREGASQPEREGVRSQPPRSRASIVFTTPSEPDSLQSPLLTSQPPAQTKRLSVTHRLSYTAKSQGLQKQNLASERLYAAHDSFLGFIASFIGLHLESRSSSELLLTTQQSVIACRQLLSVVEEVWERDSQRSEQLEQARDTMHARLGELVQATKEMFSPSESVNGDDVFMPDSGKQLVTAATSCVRSAGECVTKSRMVIERIGDFEFEHVGLGISHTIFESLDLEPIIQDEPIETEKPLPAPPTESVARPPPPPLLISESKPLPEPPAPSPIPTLEASLQPTIVESPTAVSFRSSRSSLPPLAQLPIPQLPQPSVTDSQSPATATATQRFFGKSARVDSVNVSVADSNSTYPNSVRGDSASIISQVSTRATTPDNSPSQRQGEHALMSSFGSASELRSIASDETTGVEAKLLEKTYAHELIYNKEGQISGGSLPALVEQLTTHESTPDTMFVTTFYLTFRLFTTPIDFAHSLVDRFDYVGDGQDIGVPVRLRVYNVFKGWLESHWQSDSDSSALGMILSFATGKLRAALPAAGKRLAELTAKVNEVHAGALVPRLVSSIGKTGVSNTVFSAADSNAPNPVVTKSQLNALKNANNGNSQCSILDFDPLELARQFTLIESKIFCSIQPEELLASEWTKKTDSKAVNVRAMSTLSTDLANLVADTILHLEDPKKRAIIIKHWVKISMKCIELNNYDSLMAIICSLNSSMVLRLKRTWELVSQKTKGRLEELKTIVDVGRNYAVLRQRLQNHVAPCIPFVGIYLTDLTFVDVGNQTTRRLPSDGSREGASVINFDKHMRTAKIIGQLQSFQVPYRLTAVPEMQDWMESQIQRVRTSDKANVQSYYRRSLLLEPREPQPVIRPSPQLDSSARSIHSTTSRESSRDRFDFLSNFSFSSTSTIKDR